MQLYVSLCKFTIQDPAEKPIVSMACHLVTASLSWVPLPRIHELARPILSDPVSASTRENPENQGLKTGSLVRLVRLHVTIVTLHGPQRFYLEKMQKNAEKREDWKRQWIYYIQKDLSSEWCLFRVVACSRWEKSPPRSLSIPIYSGFRLGEKILFSGPISSINRDPFPWSFQTEAIPKCCKAFLKCLSILRNTPKAKLKLNSTNSQLRMQAWAIPMVFHDAGVMSMWEFHRNM